MKQLDNTTAMSRPPGRLARGVANTVLAAVLCTAGGAAIAQDGGGDQLPFGNLIEFQSASQSSTGFGAPAKRAFDGDTDGSFANGSVTHTSGSDTFQPFWTGDIQGVAPVQNIRVWNRTDSCCSSRLSNYYVLVSAKPFKSDNLDVSLSDPDVSAFFSDSASSSQNFDTFRIFEDVRFVRVQLQGSDDALSLAEVQVFGNDSGDFAERIAPTSVAQSSTAFGASAGRASDQDVDGRFSAGSVTHTSTTFQPSWTANLGASVDISEIRIWNRTDCCSDRLSNFYVFVSDRAFTSNSVEDTLRDPNVDAFFVPEVSIGSGSEALVSDTIAANTSGRFVRVQLQGTNALSLAEVEIFGTERDVPLVGIGF